MAEKGSHNEAKHDDNGDPCSIIWPPFSDGYLRKSCHGIFLSWFRSNGSHEPSCRKRCQACKPDEKRKTDECKSKWEGPDADAPCQPERGFVIVLARQELPDSRLNSWPNRRADKNCAEECREGGQWVKSSGKAPSFRVEKIDA